MEKTFEEMMECCIETYVESEEGKKMMLSIMAKYVNRNNIEQIEVLSREFSFEWIKDIKYLSKEIERTLDKKLSLARSEYGIITNAITTISEILSDYNMGRIENNVPAAKIDALYFSCTLLGIERRILTKEEFLNLTEFEEEKAHNKGQYKQYERNEKSKLAPYGYSVSQDSTLTKYKRQELLKDLIETGEVKKSYIVSYLKYMIEVNGKKESNYLALQKWKSDLDFVLKL